MNNNNNYYFLFVKNQTINFINIKGEDVSPHKNIILIILDDKIEKNHIYKLLQEFPIIEVHYLSNILILINFEYILINLKTLHITCKKNKNNSLFININEVTYKKNSLSTLMEKHISYENLLQLMKLENYNYYKTLDFYVKLHLILNKNLNKIHFLNMVLGLTNMFSYLLIANR